jgi:hypothetical protein
MTEKPQTHRTEGEDSRPNPSVLASRIPVLLVWLLALSSCQPLERDSTKGFPDTLRLTEEAIRRVLLRVYSDSAVPLKPHVPPGHLVANESGVNTGSAEKDSASERDEEMGLHGTIPIRTGFHPDSLFVPGMKEPFQVLVNIERQEIVVTSARETLQVEENTEVSKSHFLPNYARTDDFNFDGIHEVYIQTYCGRNCGGEVYSHDKKRGGFRKVRSVNNHELHPETHILSEGGTGGRTASQTYSLIRKDWTDTVLLRFERIEDSAYYCRPDGALICNISYTPSDTCGDFPNRYLPIAAKNFLQREGRR